MCKFSSRETRTQLLVEHIKRSHFDYWHQYHYPICKTSLIYALCFTYAQHAPTVYRAFRAHFVFVSLTYVHSILWLFFPFFLSEAPDSPLRLCTTIHRLNITSPYHTASVFDGIKNNRHTFRVSKIYIQCIYTPIPQLPNLIYPLKSIQNKNMAQFRTEKVTWISGGSLLRPRLVDVVDDKSMTTTLIFF